VQLYTTVSAQPRESVGKTPTDEGSCIGYLSPAFTHRNFGQNQISDHLTSFHNFSGENIMCSPAQTGLS